MGEKEREEMMELGAAEASHNGVSPLDHLDDDKEDAMVSDRNHKDENEDESEDEESEDDDDDDDNDDEEDDDEESEDEDVEADKVRPKGECKFSLKFKKNTF